MTDALFVEALEAINACDDMEQVRGRVVIYAAALKTRRDIGMLSDGQEVVLGTMPAPEGWTIVGYGRSGDPILTAPIGTQPPRRHA
jgi:hypothetical protein